MPLNPLTCGRWDGVHLWLQWDPSGRPDSGEFAGFETDVRFASPVKAVGEGPAWGPWQPVGRSSPLFQGWIRFPTWKQGWLAQARVRPVGGEWELAAEAEFLESECDFEISSERKGLYYPPDASGVSAVFVSTVDGAVCAYRMEGELEVPAGEARKVTLRAHFQSGWSQLDRENHFDLRPSLGVRIRNLGPSRNDLRLTGADSTRIEPGPKQALLAAFGANRFQGA
jgi:hypothetical protein